jgi:hypothetical protein
VNCSCWSKSNTYPKVEQSQVRVSDALDNLARLERPNGPEAVLQALDLDRLVTLLIE